MSTIEPKITKLETDTKALQDKETKSKKDFDALKVIVEAEQKNVDDL